MQGLSKLEAIDRGPAINIAAWVLMVCMCIAVLMKAISKGMKLHRLFADDYLLLGAMAFAVGETITLNVAVANGLGQHQNALTSRSLLSMEKALYAAQFLYIIALALAKCAVLVFTKTLARQAHTNTVANTLLGAVGVWFLFGILCIAFQCGLPRPWDVYGGSCFDQTAFWAVLSALEMVLDISLVALPVYILSNLQMATSMKLPMILAFSARLLIIPISIVRMVYIAEEAEGEDRTFTAWKLFVCNQTQMNISVGIVALPFLKIILDRLQHGVWTMDLRHGGLRERSMYSQALNDKSAVNKSNGHLSSAEAIRSGSIPFWRRQASSQDHPNGQKSSKENSNSSRSANGSNPPTVVRKEPYETGIPDDTHISACARVVPPLQHKVVRRPITEEEMIIRQVRTLSVEREPKE